MLIESLAQKTRLAMIVAIAAIAGSVAIVCVTLWWTMGLVSSERNQIYVLDGQIPFLAERASLESNFHMEAKAHITLFHQYFFNVPPDDQYIKWSTTKALYMADKSAMKQKANLDEKGFYNDVVASSAVVTSVCDSIVLDDNTRKFTYYGKQIISRKSKKVKRTLITSGYLSSVPRTENNPHGLLINEWRIIENKDI